MEIVLRLAKRQNHKIFVRVLSGLVSQLSRQCYNLCAAAGKRKELKRVRTPSSNVNSYASIRGAIREKEKTLFPPSCFSHSSFNICK